MTTWPHSSAFFSADGTYRYELTRAQEKAVTPSVIFVMLNPSTADEKVNDPTVARCCNFALSWGYDNLVVLNLFALRATDPKVLYGHPDPIGPVNNDTLRAAMRDQEYESIEGDPPLVVCAWGEHGALNHRGDDVLAMIRRYHTPHYLMLNKSGQPRHPLYLPGGLTPTKWV